MAEKTLLTGYPYCYEKPKKRICEVCDRPLVAIGNQRKNGKGTYNDWDKRTMHKKCYFGK